VVAAAAAVAVAAAPVTGYVKEAYFGSKLVVALAAATIFGPA
jgi:hypothetical protein